MKSKRSKACDISQKTKKIVFARDGGACIICGKSGLPNSHYISRAKGGLGIEQNVVTMCIVCHDAYDNGKDAELRDYIKNKTKEYLQLLYKDWNEDNLIYKKYGN